MTTFVEKSGGRLDVPRIRRLVLRHCAPEGGDLVVEGPVAASRFSLIFRGTGSAFATPVAIKLFLAQQFGAAPAEAARAYHAALVELRAIGAGNCAFPAVEPFGLIAEHGIVVTEWIAGVPLSQVIAAAPAAEAAPVVRAAGAWLGRVQAATRTRRRPLDTGAALERLGRSMAANRAVARGRAVRDTVLLLQRTADAAAETGMPWCRSHGDFKPRNLMLRNGRVYAIDLELRNQAPAVHDAAHFLNHMHLLMLRPRGLYRLRALPDLARAFEAGHAQAAGAGLPALPLAWERLRNAVHLLVRHREWTDPPRSWATSLPLRLLVRDLGRALARKAPGRAA